MLGEETRTSDGALAGESRDPRARLAEACRGVRERLEAVLAQLAALRLEIEHALDDRAPADPEGPRV